MADSKMDGSGFTTIVWNGANIAASYLVGYFSSGNIRILFSELAKFILNNRSLGGTGDLVGLSGVQVLTDKDLTNPKINGSAVGTFVLGSNIAYLQNLATNVQAAITSFTGSIATLLASTAESDKIVNRIEKIVYSYSAEDISMGSPTKTIAAETLITAIGESTSEYFVKSPVNVSVYSKSVLNEYYLLDTTIGIKYTRTNGAINLLDDIVLTNLLTSGTAYSIYITFSITDNPLEIWQ